MHVPKSVTICGVRVGVGSFGEYVDLVSAIAPAGRSVHFANAKTIVDAIENSNYMGALNDAWLVLPDGAPVADLVGKAYGGHQERIAGPDILEALLNGPVLRNYFIVPTLDVAENLTTKYPSQIVGITVPGIMEVQEFPVEQYAKEIDAVGATHVWVGLGSPKQDYVASRLAELTSTTVLAVGAALEFSAGIASRAPRFLQRNRLEWLHRLVKNPRRLWRRYLIGNLKFLWLTSKYRSSASRPQK